MAVNESPVEVPEGIKYPLLEQLAEVTGKLEDRPSWDEYFMCTALLI